MKVLYQMPLDMNVGMTKKKMTKKYWGMIATTEKKTVITALEPNSENNATKD